jgi:hypothetical protein
MKQLTTTIDIAAPLDAVWAALTDLPRHAEWNPFITDASGSVQVGERLEVRLSPPGGKPMTFRPRVTAVVAGRTIEWRGRLVLPGLFTGRHRFELHPIDTGTRLVQSEVFTGVLVPFLARQLDAHTLPGFVAMNEALKVRVEHALVSG